MMGGANALHRKHAMVTGGGRDIGRAVAITLLQHAARVTLAGRNATVLAATAGELAARGTVAQAVARRCLPGSAAITGQAIAVAGGEIL